MDICSRLEDYKDRVLSGGDLREFEEHLDGCEECRMDLARWQVLQEELSAHVLESRERQVNQAFAEDLVRASRSQAKGASSRRPLAWALGTGLCAAAALVAAILLVPDLFLEQPIDEQIINAPSDRVVVTQLGEDRISLSPGGIARIVPQEDSNKLIELIAGEVACSVKPRSGDREFVVKAGEFAIRVVGTRFLVAIKDGSAVSVAVSEGVVEVKDGSNKLTRLEAGESRVFGGPRHEIDAEQMVPSVDTDQVDAVPDETTGTPSIKRPGKQHQGDSAKVEGLDDWRQWVLDGRVEDAKGALFDHVASQPTDHRAWSLLADCQRKTRDWEGAVKSYRRVIEFAPASSAQRARFRSGAILQDRLVDHGSAIQILEQYLASSGTQNLAAEAKIRIAKSRLALGQQDQARSLLEDIISSHEGTQSAEQARKLLAQ